MLKILLFLLALPLLAQVPAVNSGTATYPTSGTICTTATCTTGGPYLPLAGGTLVGNLLFTDASFDIGASGATRPRNIFLSGNATIGGTIGVTGHTTFEGVTSTGATGTGKLVYDGSPVLATPNLGTPSAIVLTNATGFPATVVLTNQANTWSTGAQDMGSATSLKLPTSAGAAPSASGQCAIDSTRGTEKCYDDLLAASTPRVTAPSTQLGSSDTLTCSVIGATTPTLFATTYTIPANTLIANKAFRVTIGSLFTASGSGPTFTLDILLGATVVWTGVANAPAAATNNTFGGSYLIQGTAAAGASVNVVTSPVGSSLGVLWGGKGTVNQPVLVATNANKVLAGRLTCSANTAGNSVTLQQLVVESIN